MNSYLTPKEIFSKYPELKTKLNWSKSDLGHLVRSKLLIGYYNRNRRSSMIEEGSLQELIQFINSSLETQKITA